jgi:cell pole-organizing protein PopZ
VSGASGSIPPRPDPAAPGDSDPSMEDILASIRRILNEDDANTPLAPNDALTEGPTEHPGERPGERKDDVLVLDPSMMVEESVATQPAAAAAAQPPQAHSAPQSTPQPTSAVLVAPEAAASAASAVSALVQALVAERAAPVHRTGPTIEDLVREELRPMLKAWLDLHLPPLVERLVRIEIERVVGRSTP